MPELVVPYDGMVITEDTDFAPGAHVLPHGIQIAADNVTLTGRDVTLISPTQTGIGIYAEGRHGLTVRGFHLSGYAHSIRFEACEGLTFENLTVRNTAEIEGIATFLDLWQPAADAYGGAILLVNATDCTIGDCDFQHQMNGILLYGCTGITVERVNASFNSGWGLYLSSSSRCLVQDNRFDFCNRVYRREEGAVRVEADAAGIVLVNGSSRNQFLRNSCLCGGDGIFIAGYRHPGDIQSCNDNLFEENDCRLSPNNAIEATFSAGNIFRRNDCSRSNYGFWMGFSWENVIEDNLIEFNRWTGIAAEHAHDFTIRNNRIRLNGEGVRLWTRGGAVMPYWQGYEVAYNVAIENNLINGNGVGFAGYTGDETTESLCHHLLLRGNQFRDNRVGAHFARVTDCMVSGNTFKGNLRAGLRFGKDSGVLAHGNVFADGDIQIIEDEG